MVKYMKLPEYTDDDILYIYKVQYFSGFAPCFDDDKFSLACCKGNKINGGMRVSICKRFEGNQNNRNVWVLGVAGGKITSSNASNIDYKPGDMIYLAKISNEKQLYTWQEYYDEFKYKRRDAIYSFDGNKIKWISNSFEDHKPKNENDRTCLETDCSAYYNGWKEAKIYKELKQIIVSNMYWIFKGGVPLPPELNVNRNYSCNEASGEITRIKRLFEYLDESKNSISYGTIDPFKKDESGRRIGTCKPKRA